jgi:hypothetical protein
MSAKATVTQATMQRMKRAIEREGLPFAGYRVLPDGSVIALVGDPLTTAANVPSPANPSDDGFAEWAAKHGYD